MRLQLLGVLMVSAIAVAGLAQSHWLSPFMKVDTGMVALAITYALSMTNILSSLLSSFIETEKELVSVERISEYVEEIPKEENHKRKEELDRLLVGGWGLFIII